MAPTPKTLVDVVLSHYGQSAPTNTCVSRGVYPWAQEAGLLRETVSYTAAEVQSILGFNPGSSKSLAANVTAWVCYAAQGRDGWSLIPVGEATVGDIVVWKIGNDSLAHISVVVEVISGRLRSVGAGGPTGTVFQQPKAGGGNSPAQFSYAIRPPYAARAKEEADAAAAQAAAAAAPPKPPEPDPAVVEQPEPEAPKPSGRRRATPPKIDVPDAPNNVLPAGARTAVYFANWITGLSLSGAIAGYGAAATYGQEFPLWLIVVAAVYASVSPHVSALAQANRTKVRKPA